MKARVIVCGALGRMGQKIIETILTREDMILAGVLEWAGHPSLGQKIGPLIGRPELELPLKASLKDSAEADIYIDFTSIESSLNYIKEAEDLGLSAVIGTTGLAAEQLAQVKEAGNKIPVLWAPNMSIGINLMAKIAALMAKALGPDFDLEIVESHHNQKKDAPSGTAVKLYEALAEARGLDPKKAMVSGREGLVGARTKDEIGVFALRGGDIVGDHTVYYCGPGERLELTHRANSRDVFASGAVRAAAWLWGRPKGFYSIEDTLEMSCE